MELWHVLLGIAFLLAVLTFTYPIVMRIKRKRQEEREEERIEEKGMRREEERRLEEKEEEIIRILKEVKAMKERIEKREKGLI